MLLIYIFYNLIQTFPFSHGKLLIKYYSLKHPPYIAHNMKEILIKKWFKSFRFKKKILNESVPRYLSFFKCDMCLFFQLLQSVKRVAQINYLLYTDKKSILDE